MMARSGISTRTRATFALTMAITFALVAMFLLSQSVEAAIGVKNVRGYVRDIDGNFIEDIPVTINIRRASDNTVRATLTDTTDEIGFFSQTFAPADWDIGDTIEVIATHGGNQESNTTLAIDFPTQYCNVTFPYAIPEFGSMIGFAVAGGLIAAVAAVFLVVKKKK